MHLNISVLGPLQVWLDGKRQNKFEFERVRALLVYLFVEAETQHDRAALASMLWPDSSQKTGLQNLRQTLAALKRVLKEKQQKVPFLLTTSSTIGVNPDSDFSIDIHAFTERINQTEAHPHRRLSICSICMDRLEQVSCLYRGDFASDIRVDSQLFEEWLLLKQEQIHIQAMQALAKLTDYYLRHNQLSKALQKARQQIALYSLCEIGHHQLIQALAADGRRHAALKHCETYKALLAEELMVPLPTKTADLHNKIISETWIPMSNLSTPQHNLPKPITPFIGYETELALIQERLSRSDNRLMTLTGIVGSGKSRVAINAAWRELPNFRDGVYLIDLEDVPPNQLLTSIAKVLLPITTNDEDLSNQLVAYLRDKEILLILDHFDQLIESDVSVLRMLLRKASDLYILVTSRSLLRLQGEKYLVIKGLEYETDVERSKFNQSPAVRFFAQCIKVWQPNFSLETAENKRAVLKICQYCDGNPRALQLLAYGINFMPLNQLSPDIKNTIVPGELSSYVGPQRHRGLQEMFACSWDGLSNKEKELLISLSVFDSTFNLSAAQAVAQVSPAMLLSLHAKSWLQLHSLPQIQQEDHALNCPQNSLVWSYKIPKLFHANINKHLRKYPTKQLSLQMAHAIYYMNFLHKHMEGLLDSANQAWILNTVKHELENIQQAWDWAIEHKINDLATQIEHDLTLYYIVENRRHRHKKMSTIPPQLEPIPTVPFNGQDSVRYQSVGVGD